MSNPTAKILDVLPLSPLQNGLLYHSLVTDEQKSTPYTVQAVLGVRGVLDRDLLARSLDALIRRHDNLRVAFRQRSTGETVQVVLASMNVPLRFVEATGRAGAEQVVAQVASAERSTPFDLARKPAIRFALVQTAPDAFSLIVTNHHILMDGWSLPVLLQELFATYAAGGSTAALAPVTPFKAYLDWLSRQDKDASLAQWRTSLGATLEPTLVAQDRDGAQRAEHSTTSLTLGVEETSRLLRSCQQLTVTANTAVQTAWALTIAQLTNQPEVVFGATVSGRPAGLPGVEQMVGLFINTVPVRVQLPAHSSLGEVMRTLQSQQSELLEHQHVPLSDLHSLTRTAELFDTLTVFENYPLDAEMMTLPGTGLKVVSTEATDRTHYPLTLVALPGEQLTLRLDHRHDVADPAAAERLLARIRSVLAALVRDPDTPIGALQILEDREREQVLQYGQPDPDPAADTTVGVVTIDSMVAGVAGSDPHRTALSHHGIDYDYATLDAAADQVAAVLQGEGVTGGDLVAVLMDRSPDLVVAVLGIQRAGAAYLPIDPSYPGPRIEFMLTDAAPALVLTDPTGPPTPAAVRALTLTGTLTTQAPARAPAVVAPRTADDPAYVIYTSGSTGQPKGVILTHAGVGAFARTCADRFFLETTSRVLQFSSPSFDAFVLELCSAFGSGATLVIPEETPLVGDALDRVLRGRAISHALIPPAALATLESADYPDLCTLVVGGDATPAHLVDSWSPGRRMVNAYGPTEATVVASTGAPMSHGGQTRIIGTPVHGTTLLVLDHSLRLCPPGVAGELHIGGPGLALGYLNRPALTAERFVADPFSDAPGARLYRTGDLVRWTSGGELEFLGRTDRQVKIRGFRIELREIESVILAHPTVRQCAVVVRTEDTGRKTLAAYVVARDGAAPTHAQLREHVATTLPEHMVPATTTMLEVLPVTANGSKIDVAALPAPAPATSAAAAPATGATGVLAGLFAQLLGAPQAGADDSFFELGGDSILSIQLVTRARAAGLSITPRQVFELRTPARLAALATPAAAASPHRPQDAIGACPTTPVMEWLREQGGPIDSFHQSMLVHTPAGLDREWVLGAVTALTHRHEALRATLTRSGSGWSLQVPERGEASEEILSVVDAAGLPEAELAEVVAQHATTAAAALSPEHGRMCRFVWFDRGADRGQLLMLIHHLVVDGVSWRILCEDLTVLHDDPATEPPASTSWRQWSRDLQTEALSEQRTAELEQWVAITRPTSPLGARALDPAHDTVEHLNHRTALVPTTTTHATLTTVPTAFHGEVGDVLLAALTLAVARWRESRAATQDDLLVDLERHGREPLLTPTDTTRTVGWFTSIQPVRLPAPTGGLTGDLALGSVLKAVKQAQAATPGDGLGYGLLRYLNPQTGPMLTGRSEIGFNYLGRFTAHEGDWSAVAGQQVLGGGADPDTPLPHALEISALTRDGADGPTLELAAAHPAGMFTDEDAEAILTAWVEVLQEYAESVAQGRIGGRAPSDLPLLPGLTQTEVDTLDAALGDSTDLMPLTPMQQGLLFHASLDSEDVYRVQLAIELNGPLNGPALRDALHATFNHHVGLGQGFWRDGPAGPIAFRPLTLTVPWRETVTTAAELAELRRHESAQPFEVAAPPLVRAVLARTGPEAHTLVITMHHLLADGWSMPHIVTEVFDRYSGHTITPAVDVRDYLTWAVALDTPTHLNAWQERLTGIDTATRVADTRLGDDMTVAEHLTHLSTEQSQQLQQAARARGVTVNSMVQTAWALVLAARTGRTDVVFGATTSGRPPELPGVDRLVGLFINTLPVRVALNAQESLSDLVARVQSEQTTMLEHQYVPLADVQEAVGVGELFDTLTVFENYPLNREALTLPGTGLTVAGVEVQDAAHYPLTLVAQPGEQLQLAVKYRTAAFTPDQAHEVAAAVATVLDRIVTTPAAPVGATSAVADTTREQALAAAFGPALPTRPHHDLVTTFARQVREHPDRVALACDAGDLTYRQLDEASNRMAHLLLTHGVSAHEPVALLQTRSRELVTSTLAVLKAGGCYLPLDARSPEARLRDVLTESGARLLITDPASAATLPESTCQVLSTQDPQLHQQPSTPPATLTHPSSSAYVMYTSGSTGRPKGVVVTHTNILDLVTDRAWNHNHDRVLVHSPHAFDASTFEMWVPLLTGRQMVLAPPGELSLADLARIIRERNVTCAFLTAGLFRLLAEEDPSCFSSAREVWTGGDVVPANLVRTVLEANPGLVLANVYGPTETTTFATYHRTAVASTIATQVPIGRPLNGMRTYVLDGFLQPVPAGAPGELYIGGAGLARGYLHRPALTAERFVADPFAEPGSLMYRSGDVVRWSTTHPQGSEPVLEFVGRVDEQIKVRGFRIELGEIEAACAALPGVAQAAVIVVEASPGDKRLAAYLVGDGRSALDPARTRAALAAGLPEYMVPASVQVIPQFPLTQNGKLDRRALPAPDLARTGPTRLPRNAQEAQLCALFADVLGVPDVGIDDSFFDLGGHSLLATRLVSRLRSGMSAEVSVRTVFEHPTVADLVGRLEQNNARPRPHAVPDRPAASPAAFGQRRLWFLNELDPQHSPYKIPICLSLTGRLDRDALHAALRDVLARHEVLRTVYRQDGGELMQVVLTPDQARLDVEHDHLDPAAPREVMDEAIRQAIAARIDQPFDLANEIPLRVTVLHLGQDRYRLLMVMHHIAADGWSMAPLARDFSEAYAARRAGTAPVRAPLPVQYADYALWQRELLGAGQDGDGALSEQLDYWSTTLAELPQELTLPTDRPRPHRPEGTGGTVQFTLAREVYEPLRELAQRCSASPFMVLQAALAALLTKLGAGNDIPVGSPIAGRTDESLDELVGFFVNTLVLRTDTSGNPTFEELLGRVRDTVLTAYANQDVPFDRIVEELRPDRVTGRNPLFQVMLVVQNNAATELTLPDLQVEVTPAGVHASQFDLSFDFTEQTTEEHGTVAAGRLDYSAELFDEATAQSIIDRLVRLLGAVLAHPEQPLTALDLLDEDERRLVLNTWNETSRDDTLADVVESVQSYAQLTPSAVAVSDDTGAELTYAMLATRANWVTRRLVAAQAQPGEVAAVLMDRGVHAPTAFLGILGAEAAYTPLDVDSPPARLGVLLADSAARWILTTTEHEHRAREAATTCGHPVEVIVLDGLADEDLLPNLAHPQDLAYVLFTSGSTGRPKGAMIHRAGMHNHLMAKVEELRLSASDTIVQNAPLSFDVSVWQMFTALLVGGTTHVVGRDRAMDPHTLVAEVSNEAATVLEVVPSMLRAILDHWDETGLTPELPNLRSVMVTGETLPAALCRRWFARFEKIPLINAYGPTECSDDVTHAHLSADSDLRSARVPIGRAVRNTRLYVLDEALQPVPVGVIGELCVGGTGVGHGYLGDPVKTALAFVPDPFGSEPGARLYRTGDQVRYTRDGQLEFLGRLDHQVKIRGQRIELSEIESVMHSLEGIRDALLVVRPGPGGEKTLVAYAVTQLDQQWIRQELSLLLPDAMIPTVVVTVPTFPLTRNGKIDRAALPEPDFTRTTCGRLPRTATEFLLADVFSEVLAVPAVGVEENFFTLGGHSLLATKVLGRVQTLFDTHLPVRTLFDHPTVAALAATVDAAGHTDLPLLARERPELVPLSAVQRRLWFLSTMDPGAAYNVPMAVRLRGRLDPHALTTAIHDVVTRHETLRTLFPQREGIPHQLVVAPDLVRIPMPVTTVTQDELNGEITRITQPGFDLAHELPIRAHLLRTGTNEHVLVLVLHHIACDGGSLLPLTRDIGAAYTARAAGQDPRWELLPVQYADFSLWQNDLLAHDINGLTLEQTQLGYWCEALAGVPDCLQLPTDRPRPAESDFTAATVPVEIDHELHTQLEQLARQHNVSLAMVLQGAFVALLRRLGCGADIPLALPVSGRHHEQLEPLIGFFVNTLIIRHELEPTTSFGDLLTQVRDRNLAGFSHQDVPFERLVEVLNPPRSLTTHALAQVAFSFQPAEHTELTLEGLAVDLLPLTASTAKFDLSMKLSESRTENGHGAGVAGVLEYRTDLFDHATVEQLGRRLQQVLTHVVTEQGALVDDLPVITAPEQDLVLTGWNHTTTVDPTALHTRPWWARVVDQAARTPHAPAVHDGARTWTYRELDHRSTVLARDLIAAGVGPEDYVGVAVPRSFELFISLLAVGKTGAAYLPIETTYPRDRIELLLATVAPTVVLTTAGSPAPLPQDGPIPILVDATLPLAGLDTSPITDPARRGPTHPHHPAYAIFTSGSTGRPKGVVIDHAALGDYLSFAGTAYDGISGTTVLHSPVSFDLSVTAMLVPLTVGGAVRVATLQELDPETSTALAADPATFLKATPSHLPLLQALPGHYAPTTELLLGGELLTGAVVDAWRREHPTVTVLNMYGPTETTVNCTQLRIEPGDVLDPGPLPIGRPLDNHQALVLDERLHPVPPGVPGELYMAGNGLARGYFDQPGLTAARFVPNPWGDPGERMYRTGDIVRWNHDGQLVFMHRVDDQVKIRGFRVELGETQAALRVHPTVRESVVTVDRAAMGDRLVGYVTLHEDATIDPAGLREHVATRLPGHLVPDVVVIVETIALTPNGKVDWSALPSPAVGVPGRLAPRDLLEVKVAEAFAEVLGLPTVGVEQSFFDLGGHSLLASRLLARLRTCVDADISIRTLFEAPTVAGLCARVRQGGEPESAFDVVLPLRPHGDQQPLWCVHPASGFSWSYAGLSRHLDPGVPLYGLQAPGLDGSTAPVGEIAALAALYVSQLREVQPQGPYRLLGWSFGGIVAHEMTAQLEEAGERVELLALLDAFPKSAQERTRDGRIEPRQLYTALLELAGYDASTVQHGEQDPAGTAVAALNTQGGVLGEVSRDQLEGIYNVFVTNTDLARTHQPRPVQADTLLFVATRDEDQPHSENRWAGYLQGELRRVDVACHHNDMTSPAATETIGGELAHRLAQHQPNPTPIP